MHAERELKARIMVVEDNPTNARFLARGLSEYFRITLAVTGTEALDLIRHSATRPDLILLDVMLPDISGHQIITRLKQDPATRAIPVIFISAMDDESDEARGLALGAADYIVKPFSLPSILARIRAHLELARLRGGLEALRPALAARAFDEAAWHQLASLLE